MIDRATILHLAGQWAASGVGKVFAYAVRATGTSLRAVEFGQLRTTVDGLDTDGASADAAEALAALPALAVDLAAEVEALKAEIARRDAANGPPPPPPPSLRTRRQRDQQRTGHRVTVSGCNAGADCPTCNVQCEPLAGWGWRCPRCGLKGEACGNRYYLKACELPRGHEGDHESRSGTSWPQEAAS